MSNLALQLWTSYRVPALTQGKEPGSWSQDGTLTFLAAVQGGEIVCSEQGMGMRKSLVRAGSVLAGIRAALALPCLVSSALSGVIPSLLACRSVPLPCWFCAFKEGSKC